MSLIRWKAEYHQYENIVLKIIQLKRLKLHVINISFWIFKSKRHANLFNYLFQIIKNNQLRNVKDGNNIISIQNIYPLKSLAITRFPIFYQKTGMYLLYFIQKFLFTLLSY